MEDALNQSALSLSNQLIDSFEQCRLSPYLPTPKDRATVGWGNTFYQDGTAVTLDDPALSQDDADALRDFWVQKCLDHVNELVTVPLTAGQQAALTSFQYNTGALAGHTLLKLLNQGDYKGAAAQLLLWDHQDGQVIQGLYFRREKEQALFLEGV